MNRMNALRRASDFFAVFSAAVNAARATENSLAPKANDLRALGIHPDAFKKIVL